mmetsp:Transcript_9454/g.18204  ORF Transcript_9454/g.18204 Transcript_9454/m.18204 type:complete len:129 (-) Transcript_9454:32-418(-)
MKSEEPREVTALRSLLDSCFSEYDDDTLLILTEFYDSFMQQVLDQAKYYSEGRKLDEDDARAAVEVVRRVNTNRPLTRDAIQALALQKNRMKLPSLPERHTYLLPPEEQCLLSKNTQVVLDTEIDVEL